VTASGNIVLRRFPRRDLGDVMTVHEHPQRCRR
jgi:hypothetical protein